MEYDVETTEAFDAWLDSLTDDKAAAAIAMRIVRLGAGLLGDVRSLGDGVSEMKVNVGQGYRTYFTIRGRKLVILLMGGTKQTQKRDIKAAKAMVADLE